MKKIEVFATMLGTAVLFTQAIAAPVVHHNEAAFRAAGGATTTYGFETNGVVEGVDLASPVPASDLDNNFRLDYTNLNAFQIIDSAADPGVVDGTHSLFTHSQFAAGISNYQITFSNFGGSNESITAFGLTITDFASNLSANDPPVSITYDTGGLSGTLLSIAGGQAEYTQNFIGLTVDPVDAFASITLTLNDNLSGFQSFDEVIYSRTQIPEPGSLALLGLGLAGLSVLRRRR